MVKWAFSTKALLAKFPPEMTAQTISEVLGVLPSTIERWRCTTCNLEFKRADEMAVRIGLHPCEIWDNWFDEALCG